MTQEIDWNARLLQLAHSGQQLDPGELPTMTLEQAIEQALAHGADINTRSPEGRTPLISAVMNRQPSLVRFLLGRDGVDGNARDHTGNTALIWAASLGLTELVEILLREGGDLDITVRGLRDRTVREWAQARDHGGVLAALDDWQAAEDVRQSPLLAEALAGAAGKEACFSPDAAGRSLLEYKSSWEQLATLDAALRAGGDSFSVEDLLQPRRHGKSLLQRGIEFGALDRLFDPRIWEGRGTEAARLWEAVPESARGQVAMHRFISHVNARSLAGMRNHEGIGF